MWSSISLLVLLSMSPVLRKISAIPVELRNVTSLPVTTTTNISSLVLSDGTVTQPIPLQSLEDLLGDDMDPGFSIEATFPGKTRLDTLSCFMLTILALHDMALQDFKGEMIAPLYWSPRAWGGADRNTLVSVKPAPQFRLPRRFAIWGFFQAINHFINSGGPFFDTDFILKFRGHPVGTVSYARNRNVGDGPDSNSTDPTTRADISNSTTSDFIESLNSSSTASDLSDSQISLSPSYVPNARFVPPPGIFIPLAASLVHLAHNDTDTKLLPFRTGFIPSDSILLVAYEGAGPNGLVNGVNITTTTSDLPISSKKQKQRRDNDQSPSPSPSPSSTPVSSDPPPPLSKPGKGPFFTIQSCIEAVWSLSKYINDKKQFKESVVKVKIDGKPVGAVIVKLRSSGGLAGFSSGGAGYGPAGWMAMEFGEGSNGDGEGNGTVPVPVPMPMPVPGEGQSQNQGGWSDDGMGGRVSEGGGKVVPNGVDYGNGTGTVIGTAVATIQATS